MKKIIIFLSLLVFTLLGCDKNNVIDADFLQPQDSVKSPEPQDSVKSPVWMPDLSVLAQDAYLFEFKDVDSNVYHAIQIGQQIWSKENLRTTHYNDGTPISNIQATSQWIVSAAACCHYNNDASISAIYGLLYNYYAAASDKLAPKGWHVATLEDWDALMVEIGNHPFSTIGDVGALVDPRVWPEGPFYFRYDVIECTNSTLFTALPNGYRDHSLSSDFPEFDCIGYQASWWALNKGNGVIIYLDQTFGIFSRDDRPKSVGSGIRLVKDAE